MFREEILDYLSEIRSLVPNLSSHPIKNQLSNKTTSGSVPEATNSQTKLFALNFERKIPFKILFQHV